MRPPEGYCGACHYMIELTVDGRLPFHGTRAVYVNGTPSRRTEPCAGTGSLPATVPGTEDPAVAFSAEPRIGRCPVCLSDEVVQRETSGRAYMTWHQAPNLPTVCPGTWDPIEYVAPHA